MSAATTLQQLPIYGRKYQLLVKFPADNSGNQTVINISDSSFEPEALRIRFNIYMPAWQNYWYADIEIWNVDELTAVQLLGNGNQGPSGVKQGMEVILSAGYQNGNYGIVWDGFVLQPMWDRENVTDFKVTLHCVIGLDGESRNSINATYGGSGGLGTTQQQILMHMMKDCFRALPVPNLSSSINNQPLPRGKTVFGNPKRFIDWIAADNNMQAWLTSQGWNMAGLATDTSPNDVIVYTPNTGLIGTPVQTQDGADITLLLDPRVQAKKPYMMIALDNVVIRQYKAQINAVPGLLDQDQQYVVAAVRHYGDTRENDWYTEVTGVSQQFIKQLGGNWVRQ